MKPLGKRLLVALVLLAILSGCAVTSVRQHPDFASGKRKINVVAMLPSEVEYRHLVFTGENERDAEQEKSIATAIESAMSALLQKRGYTTKSDILDKARAGDKEFNFKLEQLRGAYVQVAKELYTQPLLQAEESNKFKVGVGPLANPFAAISGADALMLVRYQGFDKSGGLVTKEIVASALLAVLTGSYYVPAKDGGQIELSLIDGITGDVLWSNISAGPGSAYANLVKVTATLPSAPLLGDAPAAIAQAPASAAAPAETQLSKTEAAAQPNQPEKTP